MNTPDLDIHRCKVCGVPYDRHPGFSDLCRASQALKVTGTEADVCFDIQRRQQLGINKYGTTVRNNPLPLKDWLQHAYEECLDQAVYLKRSIEEMELNTYQNQP